ncbi:MAG: hypothetical protein HKP58_15545 [Desulfatitalea sp.]|nr:Coenzyme F420 hydrogenase/dehydrogenase, beta subunit C-terminal domain [Desulfatitalea sp.]NNK01824.1 hypothetical protein [Desulfatitalea sp.]
MRIYGPQTLFEDVQQRGLCIGCGGCVALCPHFKTYKGKTARLFPCDRETGRCHAYCPKAEVDLDELARQSGQPSYPASPAGGYQRIVASRSGRRLAGQTCQSGGTVTALMTLALASGRIESAVLTGTKGLVPHPVRVTHPDGVAACASSKYTAAPTLSGLNAAIEAGRRHIGVVATPCQATAIAQMRANPLQQDDFQDPAGLVIGLFCTWALDTRHLIAFLDQRMDTRRIRKMTIPPPPAEVLIIRTDTGDSEIPLDQIRPLIPGGCRICPDMTAEWADLSVGELEGRPAWNTLIVRSETGRALVDEAARDGWLETESYPSGQLDHLLGAARGKKRRALQQARADGLLNSAPDTCRAALRLDAKTVDALIGDGEECACRY